MRYTMPKAPPPGTTTLDDPASVRRSSRGRGRGRGRGRSDRSSSASTQTVASFGTGRGRGDRTKRPPKALESLSFDRDARSAYLTAQPRAGVERRKKSAARREAKEKEARSALRRTSRQERRERVKKAMLRYQSVLDPSVDPDGEDDGDRGGRERSDDEWRGFDSDNGGDAQKQSRSKGRSKTTSQAYTVQREGVDGEDEGEDQVTVTVTKL